MAARRRGYRASSAAQLSAGSTAGPCGPCRGRSRPSARRCRTAEAVLDRGRRHRSLAELLRPQDDQRRVSAEVDALGDPRVVGDVLGLDQRRASCRSGPSARRRSLQLRSSTPPLVDDQQDDHLAGVVGVDDVLRAGPGRPGSRSVAAQEPEPAGIAAHRRGRRDRCRSRSVEARGRRRSSAARRCRVVAVSEPPPIRVISRKPTTSARTPRSATWASGFSLSFSLMPRPPSP